MTKRQFLGFDIYVTLITLPVPVSKQQQRTGGFHPHILETEQWVLTEQGKIYILFRYKYH